MRIFHLGVALSTLALGGITIGCGGGDGSSNGGSGGGTSTSTEPVCGNGVVEDGETCDDGDKNADTGACKTDCTPAACGDGLVGPAEECDEGMANSDTGTCTSMCKKASCGDALVQQGAEECDNGSNNGDTTACTSMCKQATCGDKLVYEGTEECDDGAGNSDTAGCTLECKLNVCGDGKIKTGVEQCDDGAGNSDTAACTSMCKVAKCGDGLVESGVEGCDDGNMVDTDGCTNKCTLPACGDGVLQAGEECDLGVGGNSNTGACTVLCKKAACGDGFTQDGVEECDNGAQNNNAAACTATCKNAKCGDGFIQAGVEECDLAAQNSNTGGCTLMCKAAKCGDGFIQAGVEACDDGNMTPADGCNTDCVVSATVLWTQTYPAAGNGGAAWAGNAVDAQGNVYVTGAEVVGATLDIVVRKYTPAGTVAWTQNAAGTGNGADWGQGITLDAAGNVIVIGYATNAGTGQDIWIRKYNGTNGATIWTQQYNGPLNIDDEGFGVAGNAAGDFYVTGGVQNVAGQAYNLWYGKIAGINGTIVYQNAINGAGNVNDIGVGVRADANNNFVITGAMAPNAATGDVWTTLFHDNVNSATVTWTRTYNGISNGDDQGAAVAFDAAGNILVAGTETVNGQGYNGWLRKYDMAGNTVWTQTYNDAANLGDIWNGVSVDAQGNIVVAGAETGANMKSDVLVRKYTSAGAVLWTKSYNGNLDDNDSAYFCAVDGSSNVYVAGYETIAGPLTQAWLRKYAP